MVLFTVANESEKLLESKLLHSTPAEWLPKGSITKKNSLGRICTIRE
jgi:hypothetical protein